MSIFPSPSQRVGVLTTSNNIYFGKIVKKDKDYLLLKTQHRFLLIERKTVVLIDWEKGKGDE